ncbi:MAG: biotin--[acetyl-CoA-carboxylase] ligase [Candidatus Latescibacteria bacterium 4484_107]|nr:MAG: biotin--[acetyl-CoA-carboxylase] ligase [Candidatus Latescibacteria bacterium 4484_107]
MPEDAIDDRVVDVLRGRSGETVLPSELSERLGVPSESVRDGICTLRDQGYEVEEHPVRGMRLLGVPDRMLEREILHGLDTKLLGRRVRCYGRVRSTNDVAMRLAEGGAPEGTLVAAECQTGGRGRSGRSWDSPEGMGIWASLVLRPGSRAADAHRLGMCAGVGIVQTLARIGVHAALKWPNDIRIGEKKVGGILTETQANGDRIRVLVLGFGVNVNQTKECFREDLRDMATSLRLATGRIQERVPLLQRILRETEAWLLPILRDEGAFGRLLEAWQEACSTLGKWVKIEVGEEVIVGRAVEIGSDGALVVDRKGKCKRIRTGHVLWQGNEYPGK